MPKIGRKGSKLSFSIKNPKNIHSNKNYNCFDPYWEIISVNGLKTRFIYFTFNYLHIQTEELIKEVNAMMKEVLTIKLLDKEKITLYESTSSYSNVYLETTKEKENLIPVLKGYYKIIFNDWILETSSTRKIARVLGYMMHHIFCSFSPSENWLYTDEKYSKIDFKKYKVKDLIEFIIYLSNNRNKNDGRSLSTDKITKRNLTQLGNKKKIKIFAEYPSTFNFSIIKQTKTLQKFNLTLAKIEKEIKKIKDIKKIIKKTFGKPGDLCILCFSRPADPYVRTKTGTKKLENNVLCIIKEFSSENLYLNYIPILDYRGNRLIISGSGKVNKAGLRISQSCFSYSKDGKLIFDLKKSFGKMKGVTKVQTKTNSKKTKEILLLAIKNLEKTKKSFEASLKSNEKILNSDIKELDMFSQIKTITCEKDQEDYQSYIMAKRKYVSSRGIETMYRFKISVVKYYIKKLSVYLK